MKAIRYFLAATLILCFSTLQTLDASEQKESTSSQASLSPQTQTCLGCHAIYTPGIVQDWMTSRHSKTIPAEALKKAPIEKRISAESLPQGLQGYAVGCYECHSLNPDVHKDNFKHMGHKINVVVTPNDCRTCHPAEARQFLGSKKSNAYKNLMGNAVYRTLVDASTGIAKFENGSLSLSKPSDTTLHETCLGCHGTDVTPKGMKTVNSRIGPVEIPALTNWPNQGVGRLNPDGSTGTCSACHARHGFLIEVARKPYTCGQCHHEPDVPAWNVYEESKHGNIYSSKGYSWNFTNVPWKVGEDFKAPTCATCHNSLLVSPENVVIAERSHNFGARLWVRIFGLIYSHPQPKSGDTTVVRNRDGLPLPVTFAKELASEYLIDAAEQNTRLNTMEGVCKGCHSSNWTEGHFSKFHVTVKETDEMTATATKLLSNAWQTGIEDRTNPFDESIEKMWVRQWLFYSTSVRYASAMTGAPDYTSFKNGWWQLNENMRNMKDRIEMTLEGRDKD